jgi:SM-20-related protein
MTVNDTVMFNNNSPLFESIANDIESKGVSINTCALPSNITALLVQHINDLPAQSFQRAGVGRGKNLIINEVIRTDDIAWITDNNVACSAWLNWTSSLQNYLNKRLYLGLCLFESHFAYYKKGDYYKKHKDAFKGEGNRVLSIVIYLNQNWADEDGGKLVIYNEQPPFPQDLHEHKTMVSPTMGTIVVFLSEEFPHEVLTAKKDRYSIAGWFRGSRKI